MKYTIRSKQYLKDIRGMQSFIKEMPDEIRLKLIKKGFRAVAKVMKRKVEQNLNTARYRLSRVFVRVEPAYGWYKNRRIKGLNSAILAQSSVGSGYSAAWMELGTAERVTKSGRRTGRLRPQEFMLKAVTREVREASLAVGKYASNHWPPMVKNMGRRAGILVGNSRLK